MSWVNAHHRIVEQDAERIGKYFETITIKDIIGDSIVTETEEFSYKDVSNREDLINFVSKFRIAFYNYPYNGEPPMTPFLVCAEGIVGVHEGDIIRKEWFEKKDDSAFSYDLVVLRNGNTVEPIDMLGTQLKMPPVGCK